MINLAQLVEEHPLADSLVALLAIITGIFSMWIRRQVKK